jgi:hypothetical protein
MITMTLNDEESRILINMKTSEDMLKNLLRNYILIASGYTYDLRPEKEERERRDSKKLLFGYSIGGSGTILKDLYIESLRGVRTYLETITRLNTLSFSRAVARANVIEKIITGMPEYSKREDLYVTLHDAARRMLRYVNKDEILEIARTVEEHELPENICVGNPIEVCEGVIVTALAFVAMGSPISRLSLGIRQLASHELLRYALEISSKNIQNRDSILKMISRLLSVITVDTYIWLPYHFSKLLLTYGGELTFSIAATTLDSMVKKITRDRMEPRDILCSLENYSHRFSRDIYDILGKEVSSQSNLHTIIKNFANSYKEKILSPLGVERENETLFGRLPYIIDKINKEFTRETGSQDTDDPIYMITVTEQTSPLYLKILAQVRDNRPSRLWPEKLILIYTPQTYINYIYTLHILSSNISERKAGRLNILKGSDDFKNHFCKDREGEIVVYPIVIPSTEGEIVRLIAKGIRNKIEQCISSDRSVQLIGLLQGLSMISVPLYIELSRLKKDKSIDIKHILT